MRTAKLYRRPLQRRRLWVLLTVFVSLWYVLWEVNRREPVYSNEPLSTWMVRMNDPATAPHAAQVLRDMGPEALPTLVEALNVHSSRAADVTYDFVAKFHLAPQRVYDSPNIRATAAYLLGQMGTNAAPAVPDLIEALDDEDAYVRIRATRALTQIGEPAVTNLMVALTHRDELVRAGAAKALSVIRK
jgi:HEAT repeat protein